MKKNLKSLLAMSLASILTFSLGSTNIYASENSSTNVSEIGEIRDILLSYDSTYFLFEDGTLWVNDREGDFLKIYENVKSITQGDWGDIYLILEDGTLLSGKFYKNEDSFENTMEEIATDVKAVAGSYTDIYIIKNDDTLWYSTFGNSTFGNSTFTGGVAYLDPVEVSEPSISENPVEEVAVAETAPEATVSEEVSSEVALVGGITSVYPAIQEVTVSSPSQQRGDTFDFIQIAEDVKDVRTFNGISFIIDSNDKLSLHLRSQNELITAENLGTIKPVMDNVADVQMSYQKALILDNDNKVYYVNMYGEDGLRDIKKTDKVTPTLISNDVESLEVSNDGYLLVKEDGTLWATGSNHNRELGFDKNYSEELIQIDKNVDSVYNNSSNRTLYLKDDGSYWGMGDNYSKALGYVPYIDQNFFDEDGKRFIMDDVSDMFLTYNHSVITKTDGTLWKLGSESTIETAPEPELTKVADDVKFASTDGSTIQYVIGENRDLYYENGYLYLSEQDYQDVAVEVLISMGYKVEGDDKVKAIEAIATKMSLEEQDSFQKAFNDFVDAKYSDSIVASGVESVEANYYIDTENRLYKINLQGDDTLVAKDVIDFAVGSDVISIINTSNQLLSDSLYITKTFTVNKSFEEYEKSIIETNGSISRLSASEEYDVNGALTTTITTYQAKDKLEFKPTGLTNIKDVQTTPIDLATLDLNGVLNTYREKYPWDLEKANANTINIGNKSYILNKTYTDVVSFDSQFSNLAYVNSKNELWALGNNAYENFGNSDVVGEYIEEPIKVLDNVEKVAIDDSETLILTRDNKLYGMGQNSDGQLGFKPQGNARKKTTVMTPTELNLHFIVK